MPEMKNKIVYFCPNEESEASETTSTTSSQALYVEMPNSFTVNALTHYIQCPHVDEGRKIDIFKRTDSKSSKCFKLKGRPKNIRNDSE